MHIVILSVVSCSFLLAAELPTSTSTHSMNTSSANSLVMPFKASNADNKERVDNNAFLQAKDGTSTDLHISIFNFIRHAQKERYPLNTVKVRVTELEKHGIKTGWRYTILTNEETELDPLKQRIICFGMSMDMNDPDHCQTQFVIGPLKKNGNGKQLINNI